MAKKEKQEDKIKSRALAEILNSSAGDSAKKSGALAPPVRSYSQGAAGTLGRNSKVRSRSWWG